MWVAKPIQQMYLRYFSFKDKDSLPPTHFKMNLKCIFIIYNYFHQRIIEI